MARLRTRRPGCASCGIETTDGTPLMNLVGDWTACSDCAQDPFLVEIRHEAEFAIPWSDNQKSTLQVLREARTVAYVENSSLHRASRILDVDVADPVLQEAVMPGGRHGTTWHLVFAHVRPPGCEGTSSRWEFAQADVEQIRAAYDATKARSEACTARLPSPCALCGRTEVPRNPGLREERLAAEYRGRVYDAECFALVQEAEVTGLGDALDWRLSAHVGTTVKASEYGVTRPPKSHPGGREPFAWCGLDASKLYADVQSRQLQKTRAESRPKVTST